MKDTAVQQPIEPSESPRIPSRPAPDADARRARILAKTVYRELRESGVERSEVLAVATELLGLVAAEIREES
jgi:hypothetical protein